jgi:hypothetical protein
MTQQVKQLIDELSKFESTAIALTIVGEWVFSRAQCHSAESLWNNQLEEASVHILAQAALLQAMEEANGGDGDDF